MDHSGFGVTRARSAALDQEVVKADPGSSVIVTVSVKGVREGVFGGVTGKNANNAKFS